MYVLQIRLSQTVTAFILVFGRYAARVSAKKPHTMYKNFTVSVNTDHEATDLIYSLNLLLVQIISPDLQTQRRRHLSLLYTKHCIVIARSSIKINMNLADQNVQAQQ